MNIIEYIKQSSCILIVCHTKPDGDCLGAGFAVTEVCKNLGRNVDFVTDSDLPEHYKFIKNSQRLNDVKFDNYDLAIAVDCADEYRLGKFYNEFFACKNTINIDHHATNTKFGNINIVKPHISSTCELIYNLIESEGVINDYVAECLYIGISTDTGHFKHNNTKSTTYMTASKLSEYNFDASEVINNLYRSNSLNKIMLIGRALSNMEFYNDKKVCFIVFTKDDFIAAGCTIADTEGIIDYPMTIKEVEVAVCMSQQPNNTFKVSLRSKNIDVSCVAGEFGGGGHKLASGCAIPGQKDYCINRILEAINQQYERNN